jgi:hypothetical protein
MSSDHSRSSAAAPLRRCAVFHASRAASCAPASAFLLLSPRVSRLLPLAEPAVSLGGGGDHSWYERFVAMIGKYLGYFARSAPQNLEFGRGLLAFHGGSGRSPRRKMARS